MVLLKYLLCKWFYLESRTYFRKVQIFHIIDLIYFLQLPRMTNYYLPQIKENEDLVSHPLLIETHHHIFYIFSTFSK